MSKIIDKIKTDLNNDVLFEVLLPKIQYQIDNPDKKYGVISPMYSLMPCFFDYFDVEELSQEQMQEADRVINIVDNAFGGGWSDLSTKIAQERESRTKQMIMDLKHLKNVLIVLGGTNE
jgi:hypothetical protein